MQISFFVQDDGDVFKEALFFNFQPKGVQLSDFTPEGRGAFKSLSELEQAVKYLQLFWILVYTGEDDHGSLPVGVALEPLLAALDMSTLLSALSVTYVGAVIDMALMSLAAELDSPLPKGEARSTREWWLLVGFRLNALVFSKDNQELFFISEARKAEGLSRKVAKDGAVNRGAALAAAVVSPAKATGPPLVHNSSKDDSKELCFVAIRSHYKMPAGAPPCTNANCVRIHPAGYKHLGWAEVKTQLAGAKSDFSDVIGAVHADAASFKA
jgi:hypothetical protein